MVKFLLGDPLDPAPPQVYNGIFSGVTYYRYDHPQDLYNAIEFYNQYGQADGIFGLFIAPKWLAPYNDISVDESVEQSRSPNAYVVPVAKQTTLNGYVPKNKKLLTYPYNYLIVSNNVGQNAILHYEKFSDSSCNFLIYGVLNPRL